MNSTKVVASEIPEEMSPFLYISSDKSGVVEITSVLPSPDSEKFSGDPFTDDKNMNISDLPVNAVETSEMVERLSSSDGSINSDIQIMDSYLTKRKIRKFSNEISQSQTVSSFSPEFSKVNRFVSQFDICFTAVADEFESFSRFIKKPELFPAEAYVLRLTLALDFCCDEGQRTCIENHIEAVRALIERYYMPDLFVQRTERGQFTKNVTKTGQKVVNLFKNNSVLSQHWGMTVNRSECRFIVDGIHKVCQVHYPFDIAMPVMHPEFSRRVLQNPNLKRSAPIRGLVDPEVAWGNFANQAEYDNYCSLIANKRAREANQLALGLAAGAHPHSLKNPFPFGYCKLLLFKVEDWPEIFKKGEDVLTLGDLTKYRTKLNNERLIVFTLDANNNQAHLSALTTLPANSVRVKVSQLVRYLDAAFADGVCDYEELEEIYYKLVPQSE